MFQRFPHRVWRLFPLVALAATGGCFATRGDVRIVQADIATLRTELGKAQQEQKDALLQTQRMIQLASDSLARVSARRKPCTAFGLSFTKPREKNTALE